MSKKIDRNNMPTHQMCQRCGRVLSLRHLERYRTGTYRQVCNHCKWLYYVKPSVYRRIIRESEAKHN
jgi:ribosomal protein S27AE